MADVLPTFKYHRDPVMSGSVVECGNLCRCCAERRGYIYTGPVYTEEEDLDDALCPWCIASGAAFEKFGAFFVDEAMLPEELAEEVVNEIVCRTPGFNAWQTERWFACCGDAMTFLAPVGVAELRRQFPQLEGSVMANIVYDIGISGGEARRALEALDRDQGPTAFLFECTHCGSQQSYVDGVFRLA